MAGRLVAGATRRKPPRTDPPTRRQDGAKAFRKTLTEDQLHRSVADYLDWVLPPPVFWTTFPAGWGKLSKAVAGTLHACGLREGVPDILIVHKGTAYWIELKGPRGYVTPVQDEMHIELIRAGCFVGTCRSIESVAMCLRHWRIPTRAHAIQMADQVAEAREPTQPAQGAAQG